MIKCPYCKNTFDVFDKDTHEQLLNFTVELDCNFNGVYLFDCPVCNRKFSEFPWNVFNDENER